MKKSSACLLSIILIFFSFFTVSASPASPCMPNQEIARTHMLVQFQSLSSSLTALYEACDIMVLAKVTSRQNMTNCDGFLSSSYVDLSVSRSWKEPLSSTSIQVTEVGQVCDPEENEGAAEISLLGEPLMSSDNQVLLFLSKDQNHPSAFTITQQPLGMFFIDSASICHAACTLSSYDGAANAAVTDLPDGATLTDILNILSLS